MASVKLAVVVLFLALNVAVSLVAARAAGGAFVSTGRDSAQASGNQNKQTGGSSGQDDIWIGWTNWPGLAPFKPVFQPLQGTIGQITGPLSAQILTNVPMAQQIYDQYDSFGQQLTGSFSNFGSLPGLGNLPGFGSGSGSVSGSVSSGQKSGDNQANQAANPRVRLWAIR